MKINKFLMILGLSGIVLSSVSYAQGSETGNMGTGNVGTQSSTGSSYGLPTKEVTIDPANVKSEKAYPPINDSNAHFATNPNSNSGLKNHRNDAVKPALMKHHQKNHEHMKKGRAAGPKDAVKGNIQ